MSLAISLNACYNDFARLLLESYLGGKCSELESV